MKKPLLMLPVFLAVTACKPAWEAWEKEEFIATCEAAALANTQSPALTTDSRIAKAICECWQTEVSGIYTPKELDSLNSEQEDKIDHLLQECSGRSGVNYLSGIDTGRFLNSDPSPSPIPESAVGGKAIVNAIQKARERRAAKEGTKHAVFTEKPTPGTPTARPVATEKMEIPADVREELELRIFNDEIDLHTSAFRYATNVLEKPRSTAIGFADKMVELYKKDLNTAKIYLTAHNRAFKYAREILELDFSNALSFADKVAALPQPFTWLETYQDTIEYSLKVLEQSYSTSREFADKVAAMPHGRKWLATHKKAFTYSLNTLQQDWSTAIAFANKKADEATKE